jgi:hypothetical protein
MTMASWVGPLQRVRPRTRTVRAAASGLRLHRRGQAPAPTASGLQVPSPRTMDPDVDAEFDRRFRDPWEG